MIHSLGDLVTPKRLIPYLQSFVVGNTKTTAVPAVYRHAGGCAEGKCKTILGPLHLSHQIMTLLLYHYWLLL